MSIMLYCTEKNGINRIGGLLLAVFGCFAPVSCGSVPGVATDVTYCCRPAVESIGSFRVEFEDMPELLKPMLRDEASIVLAAKGIDYTEGDADAILKMTFIGTPVEKVDSGVSQTNQSAASEDEPLFNAEVRLEMKDSVTLELISSGSMSRIHNTKPGSYMHEAPARQAMRKAFTDLFSDIPDEYFQ